MEPTLMGRNASRTGSDEEQRAAGGAMQAGKTAGTTQAWGTDGTVKESGADGGAVTEPVRALEKRDAEAMGTLVTPETMDTGAAVVAALTTGKQPSTEDGTADEVGADVKLRETLLRAVQERTERARKSVVRSLAEQNGVEEQTLAEMLETARQEQAATLPPEAQDRLDAANARATRRLLLAEVKSVGAELGLIDPDAALKLLDLAQVTVTDEGEVEGVREALEALRDKRGYLFPRQAQGAWAQRVSAGGTGALTGVEEAFYRKNPDLRR